MSVSADMCVNLRNIKQPRDAVVGKYLFKKLI